MEPRQNTPAAPRGGAPKLDLDPDVAEIEAFYKLVHDGKVRYAALVSAAPYGLPAAGRAERQRVFEREYTTGPAPQTYGEPEWGVETKAPAVTELLYINAADPSQREIRAYHNVGPLKNRDDPAPQWCLSSSDILFHQYRTACARVGSGELVPLRTVQRRNVASGTGNVAMRGSMAVLRQEHLIGRKLHAGDSTTPITATFTGRELVASPADLFYAWLGTENGVSSIWLVRDYGPLLDITGISHVVVNSGQNITIHFTHP